jgi:hypothetical protein
MRTALRICCAFALPLGAAVAAAAHDFWIEPDAGFSPAAGEVVGVGLRVGEHFAGDPVGRDETRIVRFVAVDAAGREQPLRGWPGSNPAGYLRAPEGAGVTVLAYESTPHAVDLAPDQLERYLHEEGLDVELATRRARGETGGARDAFSRHAKALLRGPAGAGAGFDRTLGLELELVPERDPFALPAGGELPLRLLRAGAPLAGARVTAVSRERPLAAVQARSDEHGRVVLPLSPGEWLVKAVQLERQPAAATGGVAYRSRWASLTFRVAGETPAR